MGSSLEEVLAVLGEPDATVVGRNAFKDGILYKDIDGRRGSCYYARKRQAIRLFFLDYKVTALYLTALPAGSAYALNGGARVVGRVVGEGSKRVIRYSRVYYTQGRESYPARQNDPFIQNVRN